jgi:phosphoserine aminotransferase
MMNPLSGLTGLKALHQLDANEPPTDRSAAAWLIEIAADALDAEVITEAERDILVGADVGAAFRLARSMRGAIYKTDA